MLIGSRLDMSARSWGTCPPWHDALQEWIEWMGGIVFAMGTDYCDSQGAFDTHFACKVVVVAGHSCRLVLQLENFEQFPLEEGSDL